jgi:hypothetical protein
MTLLYDAFGGRRWITITEENDTRYLMLDDCEEGAMRVENEDPVFNYLWFHKCSFLARQPLERVLVLGAGAFTAPKGLALDHPTAWVDAVDNEPELENIGRRFFHLDQPAFARIRFHATAAEDFLARPQPPYDFIFDDLFDGFQHVPFKGRGAEHPARLAAALGEEGTCLKNLIWNPLVADTRVACEETLAAWRLAFPVHAALALGESSRGHNRLLLGRKAGPALRWDWLRERLAAAGVPPFVLAGVQPVS